MSTESAVAVRPSEVTEEQLFPEGTCRLMLVMPLGGGRARALVLDAESGQAARVVEGDQADVLALTPPGNQSWSVGVFVNRQVTITTSVGPGPRPPGPGGKPPHLELKQLIVSVAKTFRDLQKIHPEVLLELAAPAAVEQ